MNIEHLLYNGEHLQTCDGNWARSYVQHWEYAKINLDELAVELDFNKDGSNNIFGALTWMGEQGWELINNPWKDMMHLFKRAKPHKFAYELETKVKDVIEDKRDWNNL